MEFWKRLVILRPTVRQNVGQRLFDYTFWHPPIVYAFPATMSQKIRNVHDIVRPPGAEYSSYGISLVSEIHMPIAIKQVSRKAQFDLRGLCGALADQIGR